MICGIKTSIFNSEFKFLSAEMIVHKERLEDVLCAFVASKDELRYLQRRRHEKKENEEKWTKVYIGHDPSRQFRK